MYNRCVGALFVKERYPGAKDGTLDRWPAIQKDSIKDGRRLVTGMPFSREKKMAAIGWIFIDGLPSPPSI